MKGAIFNYLIPGILVKNTSICANVRET